MDYLLRFLFYMLRKIIGYGLVVGLIIMAFMLSMNLANIYIVLKDGMEMRAKVILGDTSRREELGKFFTSHFLDTDQLDKLISNYEQFNVTAYNYKLEIDWMWNFPWDRDASMIVVERVQNLTGTKKKDAMSEEELEAFTKKGTIDRAPAWPSIRYQVFLKRISQESGASWLQDGWKVDRIEFMREEPDPPTRSPFPTLTGDALTIATDTPAATGTPGGSASPAPSATRTPKP